MPKPALRKKHLNRNLQPIAQPQQPAETHEIKLPLYAALESIPLIEAMKPHPFSFSVSIKLKNVLRQLYKHQEDFETKRLEYCNEFGTLDAATNKFTYAEGKEGECRMKINEVFNQQVTIIARSFDAAEFGSYEISVSDLEILGWMFKDLE